MEKGAKGKIDKLMKFLRDTDTMADMYSKYIPKRYQKGQMRSIMVTLSLQWSKGEKLCDILNVSRYEGEEGMDNIDDTIKLLQNTISFNLPLLLKPIYAMKKPESCFLTSMQAGAFSGVVHCMIEMGILRETALFLYKELFDDNDTKKENRLELERLIRTKIKEKYKELPYWIRVQLDFLV